MTPAEQAAHLCRERGGDFRDELEAHLLLGWVFSGPDHFLLVRAVPRSSDGADCWEHYWPEECDAWFVWVGVGRWRDLLALMPYPLPWVGWYRQGRKWRESHWVESVRLLRKCGVSGALI